MLDAQIVKKRGGFTVDVHIQVSAGDRLAIFGASGAGKSTILGCIAGIENPDAGEIRLNETKLFPPPLPLHRRPLAYLTQKNLLFPHLSVADNVVFGLANGAVAENSKWIAELRERLGLEAIWNNRAAKISGGESRRVALARMLARRPPLVLLDEPFVALDRPLIRDLIAALDQWQRRLNFILIAVDHSAEILNRLCPQVAVIERGKIIQQGDWNSLATLPATPDVARLLETW
ncbi:ATP-binding cassette domain-containing protein [bacterium]|nr:ATP-binding cassette domain-containing protein [bacterium]